MRYWTLCEITEQLKVQHRNQWKLPSSFKNFALGNGWGNWVLRRCSGIVNNMIFIDSQFLIKYSSLKCYNSHKEHKIHVLGALVHVFTISFIISVTGTEKIQWGPLQLRLNACLKYRESTAQNSGYSVQTIFNNIILINFGNPENTQFM
jgi:hypothetical protein